MNRFRDGFGCVRAGVFFWRGEGVIEKTLKICKPLEFIETTLKNTKNHREILKSLKTNENVAPKRFHKKITCTSKKGGATKQAQSAKIQPTKKFDGHSIKDATTWDPY